MKTDKAGNYIGDGTYHSSFNVIDLSQYGVTSHVEKSSTTESVYVYYYLGQEKVTVRYSDHECNAIKFGDVLDGNILNVDELMFRLGLKKRIFIPLVRKYIDTRKVKKSEIGTKFEVSDVTIQELYAMPADTDITQYKGKVCKGSNYLVLGDSVKESEEMRLNMFGEPVAIGTYVYSNI